MISAARDPFMGWPSLVPTSIEKKQPVLEKVDERIQSITHSFVKQAEKKQGASKAKPKARKHTVEKKQGASKARATVSKHIVASEWHPQLNQDLNPETISQGSRKTAYWMCSLGHVWQAKIWRRCLSDSPIGNCPTCRGKDVSIELKLSEHKAATEFDPEFNFGLDPNKLLQTDLDLVFWRCAKDQSHIWTAAIAVRCKRPQPTPCPHCSATDRIKRGLLYRHELAREFHPTFNGVARPEDYPKASSASIWWQCARVKEHAWKAKIEDRCHPSKSTGCPHCLEDRLKGLKFEYDS